jgi:hypothetical protein
MTTDFTAHNLTAWGINECKRDPHTGGFGGMLGKLLLRALPDHYTGKCQSTSFEITCQRVCFKTANSSYTHFSMMTLVLLLESSYKT